jgi:hypothetical protein
MVRADGKSRPRLGRLGERARVEEGDDVDRGFVPVTSTLGEPPVAHRLDAVTKNSGLRTVPPVRRGVKA